MFELCGSKRGKSVPKRRGRGCIPRRAPKKKHVVCANRVKGVEKPGKSCNPGKVTRNAFFNFLREFRVKHCDWHVTKIAVEGAKLWCSMGEGDRRKFIEQAKSAPKVKRRSRRPYCN